MTASGGGPSVLVTGGTGFVGSHLVRRLVRERLRVHLLVRPESSLWRIRDVAPQVTLSKGDLTDPASVERSVSDSRPEIIFHLGGDTSGRRWSSDLAELDSSIAVNVMGTLALVRALRRTGLPVKRFVRAGGLSEYGNGPVPFDEAQRELPASAYSASQAAATMFLNALCSELNFRVFTLRLASVYGPARSIDFFLPSLILHCLQGRDFEMTDGEQRWDLIYVDDAVDAFARTMHADLATGEIINIGSGVAYRLREVAETVLLKIGSKTRLKIGELPDRSGEIRRLCCCNDKAKRLLGWTAITSLDAGLDRTIRWYREHLSEVQQNR